MKTQNFFTFLLLLCLLSSRVEATINTPSSANAASPMGSNLSVLAQWSPEYVFTNPILQSGDWLTQNWSVWDTAEHELVDFDANGWPRSIPSGDGVQMSWIATTLFERIDGHYPAGEYIVTYEGKGRIDYSHDATKDPERSVPGRDVIVVTPGKTSLGILLKIVETDPDGTGDYIRNIHIEMPNIDTSQQFHPDFINNIQKYKVIRMMDWQRTNWNAEGPVRSASEVATEPIDVLNESRTNPYNNARPTDDSQRSSQLLNWSDRPLPSDVRYTSEKGVPVEVMLDLVNQLAADVWFNMPHHASNEYMAEFATLTANELNDTQHVYVEYSNEVWNSGFYQNEWVTAKAEEMWPDPSIQSFKKLLSYYGMRSAEMCDIWKAAFPANPERVICVIATQAANPWVGKQMLDCPLSENAPCHTRIDAVAIAPYFGQHIGHQVNHSTVLQWIEEQDGGLGKLFQEMEFGDVLPTTAIVAKDLQTAMARMSDYRAIADERSLSMIAYEGGQHLVGIGTAQWDDKIAELFANANRDPRMAELYAQYLSYWHEIGGEMFVNYNTVGRYSKWGNWGAQEYNFQQNAVKQSAIETHIENTPCDWEACNAAINTTPTAVQLTNSTIAAQNRPYAPLLLLLAAFALGLETHRVVLGKK